MKCTNIFLRYAESILHLAAPPFPDKFSCIEDLCFAAVREFSPVALRSEGNLGAGALERPVEAQFQDEFYRSCYTLLNKHLYLTSEWSGKVKGGRVDFRVRYKKWAVECVREGHDLEEHIARFHPGGRYHKWIATGEIMEYIILDFRTSEPRKARPNTPTLYFVIFSKDYTRFKIWDAELKPKEAERALTS